MNVKNFTPIVIIESLYFSKNRSEIHCTKSKISKLLLLFMMVLCFQLSELNAQQDGVIDDPGDIVFVGYHDNDDGFSFLLLDDCPAGTSIRFTDEGWNGSAFNTTTSEGEVLWTNNTGAVIDKGTVISITDADDNTAGITATTGTASEIESGFTCGTGNDQIYAITGTRAAPGTFLAFVGDHVNDGSSPITLSGTGLVLGTTAVGFEDNEGYYTGPTDFNGSLTAALQEINDVTNWTLGSFSFPSAIGTTYTGSVFGGVSCDINITSISSVTNASCPSYTDGSFTVNATCTSCTSIEYSKDNGSNWQASSTFTGLGVATYNVKVRDTGDNSCEDTDTQAITGTDGIDPAISCPANITIECSASSAPGNTGMATATDNCTPSPTITFSDAVTAGVGNNSTITRTWNADDGNGNDATCQQTINIVDSTNPVISCPANVTIECSASNAPANTGMATATDNCAASPTITFSDVVTAGVGNNSTITRTWTATDENSNDATCQQTINIVDSTDPTPSCSNITVTLDNSGNYTLTAANLTALGIGSTDNCSDFADLTISSSMSAFTCANIGSNNVTVTITDENNNDATWTMLHQMALLLQEIVTMY